MIPISSSARIWIATGYTDMRKGFASLALQVQEVLRHDPLSGHLFCFRGRRGFVAGMHDLPSVFTADAVRREQRLRSVFADDRG